MLGTMTLAALAAGFLGSTHCASMCGPIVALFEAQHAGNTALGHLQRRAFYQTGRLGFYILLGLLGLVLAKGLSWPLGAQAALGLRLTAAALLVLLGVKLALNHSSFAWLDKLGARLWKMLSPLTARILPMSTPARSLAAGFVWGALPCGLVYGVSALAATAASAWHAVLVMFAFWLGTLPLLAGAGSLLASVRQIKGLTRLAGAMMVAAGLFSVWSLLPDTESGSHHHHHLSSRDSQNVAFLMPKDLGSNRYCVTPALRCAS